MARPHEMVKNGMSLATFFRLYPSDIEAEAQFVAWRWPDGIECPHCGSDRISVVESRRPQPWRCKDCRRHFSHTTDTPMHDTKLGPQTWLLGLFIIVGNPKGRSSVQLAADLGITQKSAWHLAHRIRRALEAGDLPGFVGPVQVDETYVGGKMANKHGRRRRRGGGVQGKTPVMGFKDDYSGRVAATPVHAVTKAVASAMVAAVVRPGAEVFTDGSNVYDRLEDMGFDHYRVLHSVGEYVRGGITTNGIENYWSGLKRCYVGTYHWWSDEHLHRYVEEHAFRYNNRDRHVARRMATATRAMSGRRLPWRELVVGG